MNMQGLLQMNMGSGRDGGNVTTLDPLQLASLLAGQGAGHGSGNGLGGGVHSQGLALGGLGLPTISATLPQSSQSQQTAINLNDLALLSQFGNGPLSYGQGAQDLHHLGGSLSMGGNRNGSAKHTKSSDTTTRAHSGSSSAYASRHQAAEQRRRTRINERLELLRKMVPHAERANTACFLEEVIKYIDSLKRRNMELEGALQASAHGKAASLKLSQGNGATPSSNAGTLPPVASLESASLEQLQQQQQHGQAGSPSVNGQQHGQQQLNIMSGQQQQQHRSSMQQQQHSLSLGGHALGSISLAQLTGLQQHKAQLQLHGSGGLSGQHGHHHSGHHNLAQQLSDLQAAQLVQNLQHGVGNSGSASHNANNTTFQPNNNKAAFLTFNEDLYAIHKQQQQAAQQAVAAQQAAQQAAAQQAAAVVVAAQQQQDAAAAARMLGQAAPNSSSPAPSPQLQLTTVSVGVEPPAAGGSVAAAGLNHVNAIVDALRKGISDSPVSSEESGVPLKKRKVLLL